MIIPFFFSVQKPSNDAIDLINKLNKHFDYVTKLKNK